MNNYIQPSISIVPHPGIKPKADCVVQKFACKYSQAWVQTCVVQGSAVKEALF